MPTDQQAGIEESMGKSWTTAVMLFASCLMLTSPVAAESVGLVPNDGCVSYLGAIFCDDDLRSTGTGTFDPFLLNSGGGSQPVTSAWNTDANKDWTQDNMANASQTDALDVSDVGTSAGGSYWTFIVDINQEGGTDSLLDLTHLQLYSCTSATYLNLDSPDCTSFYNLFGGAVTYATDGTPVISDETWITFDARNHTGSGSGDIIVFIPTSSFSITPTGFIALLDGWGNPPGTYENNDGFEEWKVISNFECPSGCSSGTSATPEPATLWLLGGGLALAAHTARRRTRR
jgi:hypothetical protein